MEAKAAQLTALAQSEVQGDQLGYSVRKLQKDISALSVKVR